MHQSGCRLFYWILGLPQQSIRKKSPSQTMKNREERDPTAIGPLNLPASTLAGSNGKNPSLLTINMLRRPQGPFEVTPVDGGIKSVKVESVQTLRPNKQPYYDQSDSEKDPLKKSNAISNNDISAYYPQSSLWTEKDGDKEGKETMNVSSDIPILNIATLDNPSKVVEIEEVLTLVYSELGSSIENPEIKSLLVKLNESIETFKQQENEERKSQKKKLEKHYQFDDEAEDVVYINVWNNVGGELKLTGQKPMLREEFEEMQSKKDFSSLLPNPNFNNDSNKYQTPRKPDKSAQKGEHGNITLKPPSWHKNIYKDIQNKLSFYEEINYNMVDNDRNNQKKMSDKEQLYNSEDGSIFYPNTALDVPVYLQGLLANTNNPEAFESYKKFWGNPQQELDAQKTKQPMEGEGPDLQFGSFTNAQGNDIQEDELQRFIRNQLITKETFNGYQTTIKPDIFTPKLVPEALTPTWVKKFPSSQGGSLLVTTRVPPVETLVAKYGLKRPDWLYGQYVETSTNPVPRSRNVFDSKSNLDAYPEDDSHRQNMKNYALEVYFPLIDKTKSMLLTKFQWLAHPGTDILIFKFKSI